MAKRPSSTFLGSAAKIARYYTPRIAGMAVQKGMQKLGSYVKEQYGKKDTTGRLLSYQHDQALRYRRKSMPRRRRRAWVRFTRKVRHVDLQMQPLQVFTEEYTYNQTTSANQGAAWGRILGATYISGVAGRPLNDEIFQIFKNAYNLTLVSQCVPYKLFVKSMCMDVQIRNNGSSNAILDVYIVKNRSKFASASYIDDQYVAALGELQATASGGTVTATKTALTPFDAPNFCSYWKILSKREINLGSGQTTTMQLRSAINRHVEGKELQSSLQCLVGSKAILVTWHGSPSNSGAAGVSQFDSTALTFGMQTVVHYAVPPSSTVKEAGSTV